MPHSKLPNYLRTHRKRADLSQAEVSFLLGTKSDAQVCRYERFARQPSLATAFAYEVLFRTPARELFNGIYVQVERDLLSRAKTLLRKLGNAKEQEGNSQRKVEALRALTASTVVNTDQSS